MIHTYPTQITIMHSYSKKVFLVLFFIYFTLRRRHKKALYINQGNIPAKEKRMLDFSANQLRSIQVSAGHISAIRITAIKMGWVVKVSSEKILRLKGEMDTEMGNRGEKILKFMQLVA